ncbi:MAG: PTS sugar transporter [Thermodesulfobacteriota bacterium]
MIGAVIITHGTLWDGIMDAASAIVGKIDNLDTVAVVGGDSTDDIRDRLSEAINSTNSGDGVIVFTDMFGGTPSNVALSFLGEAEVEVEMLAGVNLPIVLKFLGRREEVKIPELIRFLMEYGKESIVPAGDMLKEEK